MIDSLNIAIFILLKDASLDEIVDDLDGYSSFLNLVLHRLVLLLNFLDPYELVSDSIFPDLFFLLLPFDLLLCPAPLDAHLEHIGSDAFANYINRSNQSDGCSMATQNDGTYG